MEKELREISVELQIHKNNLEKNIEERTKELATANKKLLKEISERSEAEEKIKNSLEEKKIMLQEIYHRVKNNMQIMVSLIRFQKRSLKDKKEQEILNITESRIHTLSLIHQFIYNKKDFAHINLRKFVADITRNIRIASGENSHQLKIFVNSQTLEVKINFAIPLGLILHELIVKSFSTFSSENGEINIDVSENMKVISYSDNRKIMEDFIDDMKEKEIFFTLINSLVRQMRGSYETSSDNGLLFTLKLN